MFVLVCDNLVVQLLFVAVCMLVIIVSMLSSIVCVGLLSSNGNSRLLSWFLYSCMFSVLKSKVGGFSVHIGAVDIFVMMGI